MICGGPLCIAGFGCAGDAARSATSGTPIMNAESDEMVESFDTGESLTKNPLSRAKWAASDPLMMLDRG